MMTQSIKTEERKQWCFIYVKTVTKMTEEICNTSCYQIWSTNNHHYLNEGTFYVNCFHLQTTNFIITTKWKKLQQYYCFRDEINNRVTTKRIFNSLRIEFMYLNVYLLTYVHTPTTTRCLSIFPSSRPSRKLVN